MLALVIYHHARFKFLTRRLKTIAGAFKRFRTQAKAKGERVSKKLKAAEPSWGMD